MATTDSIRDLKDIIVIPVEESEESDAEDEGDVEDCSEHTSEESYGKDQAGQPSNSKGGKRHGRRIGSALSGPEQRSRSRKRRRRKKKKVKHSGSQKIKGQSKNEGATRENVNGGSFCKEPSATSVTEEEVATRAKVKRVHSAPNTVFKRINRKEMVSSTQIKVPVGDIKRPVENGTSEVEESIVMKLTNPATKTDAVKSSKPDSSTFKVERASNATSLKLSHRPWTASATEVTSTYTSPLHNTNNSLVSNKQRSMLLALSKESYQRTLPPVLHTQSMNFTLDGSKPQGRYHTRLSATRTNYDDNINTAVMKYANSKGVVLQKEVLSNARFIPIVPEVDNTKVFRSNSFLRDINYKQKQQVEKELSKSCHSLGPLSTLDRDLKPILKDSQNGRNCEKRKSVRFQVPEG